MTWQQLISGLISGVSGVLSIYEFTEKKVAHTSKNRKVEKFEIRRRTQSEIQDIKEQKNLSDLVGKLSSMLCILSAIFYVLISFSNKQDFKVFNFVVGFAVFIFGCTAIMAIDMSSSKKRKILALSRKVEENL